MVHDHERTDEANFQGEFNGVTGRRAVENSQNNVPKDTILEIAEEEQHDWTHYWTIKTA